MAAAFGLYVVFHSPVRNVVATLLHSSSRACYFACGVGPAGGRVGEAAAAWLLIAMAAAAAWVVTDRCDVAPYERPLVFGMAALAFIAGPAAAIGGIASWTGTRLLHPPLGPLAAAMPAALVVAMGVRLGWRPHRPRRITTRPAGLVWLVGGLAAGLVLASTVVSLTYPPTGYDALGYHAPLAVFLWHDGNLSSFLDRAPIVYTLAMPGTVQLWYGSLLMAGGERLADLGQLPFAIAGSLAINAFTRRLGLGGGAALLAAAAFLLAPTVVLMCGIQVADLAGAGLLMTVIALASAPAATWTAARFALVGLGLGLAATTKLALLPCVAAVMLFAAGVALWQGWRLQRVRRAAVPLLLTGLLFSAMVAPWWLRNAARYANPVYPAGIPLVGRGIFLSSHVPRIDREFVPSPTLWPLYPLLERHSERSGLGGLFVLGIVAGSLVAARRARRQPLLLYAWVGMFTLPAWWILTNHDPRFLLGLFGMAFALLPYSLLAVRRSQRRAASAVIAAAAIFSASVTLDQALLPLVGQPNERFAFYDQVWGVDPLVAALPEREGLLLQTGYAHYTYPAYYPLLGRSRTRLVLPVDVEATTDMIVAAMRGRGVRFAYVATSPESQTTIDRLYDPSRFELVHASVVDQGWRSGTRRYLYRLK
jgi:hypothetical protein